MTTSTQRPRSSYHHGNLRKALVDRAMELFAERGSFDFTLRELARDLGVTHNAPYRHFPTKEDLVAELTRVGVEQLSTHFREALASAGDDPRARVEELGVAYVRFAVEEPVLFRLVLTRPIDVASHASSRTSPLGFDLLVQTIAEAQRAGVVRDDVPAKEIAVAAWALVHGLASLVGSGLMPGAVKRMDRYVHAMSLVFFEGARAPAGRSTSTRRGRSS